MSELTEADRFLLEKIRQGDADAWSQMVDRYRGRLLAFAQSRLRRSADAEDLLQDAFVSFLKALPKFRGDAGLETYLFAILRRRIADWYRGREASLCLLHDLLRRGDGDEPAEPAHLPPAREATPSTYARRNEQADIERRALGRAIRSLVSGYRDSLNFRDLKIVELLFYCHLTNKEVARIVDVKAGQIGVIKHRCLRRLQQAVAGDLPDGPPSASAGADDAVEALLTEVWETQRPSCPKRNTIGAYLLGTLDGPWRQYVDFHLQKLGCRFCLANLEDLTRQSREEDAQTLRDRIMQSTIGFLRR